MLALLISSITMFNTKLCTLSWSVYHLGVVVVSLCIYLVVWPFKHTLLNWLLILVWNSWYHLLSFLNYLVWTSLVFAIIEIVSSWCNNSFLWICITNVVVAVSFCTCYSVSWSSRWVWLLVCKLNKLLRVLVLHHQRLLRFRCLHPSLIKWYVYSSISVA